MVAASYSGGTSIIDFGDPLNPSVVGWIRPAGADTWSSYLYRGHIYTGDMQRGFDVIEMDELLALEDAPATPSPSASVAPPKVRGTKTARPAVEKTLPGTGVETPLIGGVLIAAAGLAAARLRRNRPLRC